MTRQSLEPEPEPTAESSQTRQSIRWATPLQTLHDVLSFYSAGYSPKTMPSWGESAGFSGAEIFRIETALGFYALRKWPAASLPGERIKGLHRLLRHVFDACLYEVAVPVAALNGETLVTHAGRYWQLEPWMPGRADYWMHPSPQRLRDVMARLALFHQLTRDYADAGSARQWFFHEDQAISPAVKERLAFLNEWKETKIHRLRSALNTKARRELYEMGKELALRFDRTAQFIEAKLEVLSRVPFRLQPCLRDLWHDHVLFTEEKVTGLIDASACRSDNIAADLARLLGSLLLDDRAAWELALEEYEEHHSLDGQEKALLEALDQSGILLSGLAWMDRLVLEGEPVSNFANVLARLESLCGRLKTLDQSIAKNLFW